MESLGVAEWRRNVLAVLLLTAIVTATVVVVEIPTSFRKQAYILQAPNGSVAITDGGAVVTLPGPLPEGLCTDVAYFDVYLWCPVTDGRRVWYVNVQKMFLDKLPEHQRKILTTSHVVVFDKPVEVYVYNDTTPHRLYGDRVVLTSGVYEVSCGGAKAQLYLLSNEPRTLHIDASSCFVHEYATVLISILAALALTATFLILIDVMRRTQ